MSSEKPSLSEPKDATKSSSGGLKGLLAEYLPTLAIAGIIVIGVRTFIAEPRYIPSSSMEPTLQINDRLIIEKISYKFRKPARGEIIVFNPPNNAAVPDASKVYIKRLIGLPGDRISIHDGKVFVNDQQLAETYIAEGPNYTLPTNDSNKCPGCFQPQKMQFGKHLSFIVPKASYWMMGDNRNNSLDSHAWGFLPEENIVGRAYVRYWPIDQRLGELTVPKY